MLPRDEGKDSFGVMQSRNMDGKSRNMRGKVR